MFGISRIDFQLVLAWRIKESRLGALAPGQLGLGALIELLDG
jgi:hypothetical protein